MVTSLCKMSVFLFVTTAEEGVPSLLTDIQSVHPDSVLESGTCTSQHTGSDESQLEWNTNCLFDSSKQTLCPKKAGFANVRSFASLIPFLSLGIKHQRLAGMCTVYLITLQDLGIFKFKQFFQAVASCCCLELPVWELTHFNIQRLYRYQYQWRDRSVMYQGRISDIPVMYQWCVRDGSGMYQWSVMMYAWQQCEFV